MHLTVDLILFVRLSDRIAMQPWKLHRMIALANSKSLLQRFAQLVQLELVLLSFRVSIDWILARKPELKLMTLSDISVLHD